MGASELLVHAAGFHDAWMLHREEIALQRIRYLLEIMKEHEVTLSMGNGNARRSYP